MTQKQKHKTRIGKIAITRTGAGFFMHPDLADDIRIEADQVHTALNGDTVEILILPRMPRDTRQRGKVLKVLERATQQFVGTLGKEGGNWILTPDAKNMHIPLVLEGDLSGAQMHYKALVTFTTWDNPDSAPRAVLREVLGPAGEHETEMKAILLARGFTSGFPTEVEEQATQLAQQRDVGTEELQWREDARNITTFTIDPFDAKDFDDALSLQYLSDNRFEVGIHIADVTHYVLPGTTLDREAQKRGTSVYLVDRTIPMLPEVLSNDLCSLRPNEDRRAFSVFFEMDTNGEVHGHRFAKTLIRSNHRFTYKDAQEVLDGVSHTPFDTELNTLWETAQNLRKERVAQGAIEFETDEIQFELDEKGTPVRAYIKERLNTMKLIEEFMLLANRYVASHIAEHSKGKNSASSLGVYRVHDLPNPERLEELNIFLRALGHDHLDKDPQQIKAKDIARLMRDIRGLPEEAVVQTATLRSMAKAIYSDKNIGHFSLGFTYYTHFTSPIRRYPDMMVHRILFAHLDNSPISAEELARYRALANESSQREVDAVTAERESVKLKQVEYMTNHVGDTFEGKVTGVSKGGMFVAENTTRAEGMVRASDIPGDWFDIHEKQYSLVGRKTGKTYRIGDDVTIRLKRADTEARELDWEIVA